MPPVPDRDGEPVDRANVVARAELVRPAELDVADDLAVHDRDEHVLRAASSRRRTLHSGPGDGAGLVSDVHVARSIAASAASSDGSAGRITGVTTSAVEVRRKAVQATLAAEAGLLIAAERARRIEAVVGVRPHHPGLQPLGHPEDPRALLRPDARGEPVRRVVRLLDRLFGGAEGEHAEDRPEDLLLRDPVALRDVREDRRREPVALLGQPAGRLVDVRALLTPCGDELRRSCRAAPAS